MDLYNHSARRVDYGPLTGSERRIIWDDGSMTVHSDVPEKIDCSRCSAEVNRSEDIIRYEGLCKRCFPEVRFEVPHVIEVGRPSITPHDALKFTWQRQVPATFNSGERGIFGHSPNGADYFGNNFGVQDLVFYNPRFHHNEPKFKQRMEGVVLAINQYDHPWGSSHDKLFLTRVYFGEVGKVDVRADELEALTCQGLSLDPAKIQLFQKLLEDVPVGYDINKGGETQAFEDPVARALLMSYRQNHLIETGDPPKLNKLFCNISEKIRNKNIPCERLHLWLKKQLRTTDFRMEDEQVAALVPFLVGERVANYHMATKEELPI